jgi:hypothetical protein
MFILIVGIPIYLSYNQNSWEENPYYTSTNLKKVLGLSDEEYFQILDIKIANPIGYEANFDTTFCNPKTQKCVFDKRGFQKIIDYIESDKFKLIRMNKRIDKLEKIGGF